MSQSHEIRMSILQELLRHGQLRRRDFIVANGYRPASVLSAINELKADGRLIEPDRITAKTGRHSPELMLNPQFGSFLGLEIQPERVLGVVIDAAGSIQAQSETRPENGVSADNAAATIATLIPKLQSPETFNAPCRGLGFADPGLVDVKTQLSLQAVNVPGWKHLDAAALIRQSFAIDNILVIPETMARTYAEYHARLPHPPDSLFQISLNSGIGGGFIKDGELFIGDTGRAMEIGHLVVIPDGPQCQCGNRGCLEAIAGENGIRRKIAKLAADGVRTELTPDNFSLPMFVRAVKNRDRATLLLASEICDNIASSITLVVTLLNPSCMIISGELTGLGDILLDAIKKTLAFRCFPGATDRLKVEFSRLDEYAASYAAALMVRNRILLG